MISVFGLNADNAIGAWKSSPSGGSRPLAHSIGVRIGRAETTDYLVIADGHGDTDTWRVGQLETDARMLFCQTHEDAV
jgi:hypothetical protein